MLKDEQIKMEALIKKVEESKKSGGVDLTTDEDLSIAIMNLIGIEEHLFFTASKTEKPEYFDILAEVRANRTRLLAKMIPKTEGETWCISKHLLSATMRLIEVGNKLHSSGNKAEAKEMYEKAYEMYSLFFALRLKVIEVCDVKNMAENEKEPWTLKDIVSKLVNCCDE
ncbi:MAG: hypothetical protein WCC74_02625 [Minisyncoccia bacterium]